MIDIDFREPVQALLAHELRKDATSIQVDVGSERGPYTELRFSVEDIGVVLLCSQWETIAFVDEAIRWEIATVTSEDGTRDLAMLMRSLSKGGFTRVGKKSSLTLEDGERLSGHRP